MTKAQLESAFTTTIASTSCTISDYFVSEQAGTTEVTSGTIFDATNWGAHTQAADLTIDSTKSGAGEIEYNFKVWIKFASTTEANSEPLEIKVRVGCFEETTLTASLSPGATSQPYFY